MVTKLLQVLKSLAALMVTILQNIEIMFLGLYGNKNISMFKSLAA
jgi:hypothetical protein